jgi:uncharacterized membrane protein
MFLATYWNLVYNLAIFNFFQKLEIWQAKSPDFVFCHFNF